MKLFDAFSLKEPYVVDFNKLRLPVSLLPLYFSTNFQQDAVSEPTFTIVPLRRSLVSKELTFVVV